MAQNDFKSFAVGAGANVTSQADWEALAALVTGFQSGKASSAQINKAIRQASFIAAALAQYTSDKTGGDVLDDGDQAAFITKMAAAFGKDFQPLDATLTALALLTGSADKLAYFNGDDTAALTALTAVGRDIIGKATVADVLTYLGLGTAATKDVGTGENQIPDMSSFGSG
ncbi:TPA: phage tail protein, partial [Citrobacter amalonaticus]